MLVAVVLGNRINDDGTMSDLMRTRLNAALRIYNTFKPSKIILSGGAANKKVDISEARMMFDYLVECGVPSEMLVAEDESLTTKQNAEYSVPIAVDLGATELLVCTSIEHLSRSYSNPVKLFAKQLVDFPKIRLSVYGR